MRRAWILPIALTAVLVAWAVVPSPSTPSTGARASAAARASAGAAASAGAGGTPSTTEPVDCSVHQGPPVDGDGLSGVLRCGDRVLGATLGGVRRFDTTFYERAYCTPATTNHDGGDERVYRLLIDDPDTVATVRLDTPCADLDLAAMATHGDDPAFAAADAFRCEENRVSGEEPEAVELYMNAPQDWWIVVEGVDHQEGAFALTVDCRPL